MRTAPEQAYRLTLEREYRRVTREIARLEETVEGSARDSAPARIEAEIALDTAYAVRASLAERLANRHPVAAPFLMTPGIL
jgi:hypothetical protein